MKERIYSRKNRAKGNRQGKKIRISIGLPPMVFRILADRAVQRGMSMGSIISGILKNDTVS